MRQPAFLCGKGGHFLVVEGDAQLLCHQLADLLAGGTMFTGDGDNHAGLGGLNDSVLVLYMLVLPCGFTIGCSKELPVEHKAHQRRHQFRHREGKPEPFQPEA